MEMAASYSLQADVQSIVMQDCAVVIVMRVERRSSSSMFATKGEFCASDTEVGFSAGVVE